MTNRATLKKGSPYARSLMFFMGLMGTMAPLAAALDTAHIRSVPDVAAVVLDPSVLADPPPYAVGLDGTVLHAVFAPPEGGL
ncbi:MAG: hypothetical protein AAF646_02185 [Pseudomonadota bacterium]